MGSTLPGLIFVGISARFKLHNVINGSQKEEQRIPQRQQEIAVVVSSAGFLDLKAFTLQTKRNSRLKNVISGFSLSQWHSTLAAGPHLDTDKTKQSFPKSSVCRSGLNLVTPHWLNLQQRELHKTLLLVNQADWIQAIEITPLRVLELLETKMFCVQHLFYRCSVCLHAQILSSIYHLLWKQNCRGIVFL